jgi:hypothetical protein
MGFVLGFLLGLLTAIGLFIFLVYWLCSRSNHLGIAKAVNGVANALAAARPKTAKPPAAADDGKVKAGMKADEEDEQEGIDFQRRESDGLLR